MPAKKYSETIQSSLKRLVEQCELEDQYIRKRHIYEAKQNDLYWHGFQFIYWDATKEEFRIPTHDVLESSGATREEAETIYNYVTNIFKAHGLSIIAAIGADTPGVIFYPANANNPEDVRAAQKANELSEIIHKINSSKLVLLHSLFILFTQHMVACEIEFIRDEKYGTVTVPKFKNTEQQIEPDFYACMTCDFGSDIPVDGCPNCNSPLQFQPGKKGMIPTKVGEIDINKGFPKFNIWGSINVRVPSYAADQDAIGYLFKYTDQHISWLKSEFKDLNIINNEGDSSERFARAPSTSQYYYETETNNLRTFKQCWLRPTLFYLLDTKESTEELEKEFPEGCYVAFAGESYCEARPEKLDDIWTITKGDLSRTVHADPLGKALIPIQDIRNTTSNLLLECLEQSLPINIADPEYLDFNLFSNQEVKPGLIYQGKKPPQAQSIQDGFYSFKTATLPKEGTDLQKLIDEDGQFVSGDFPSVFGGQGEGSKTLGEYQESQVNALRRLAIPNYYIYVWWSHFTHKAVKLHIRNMVSDDEHTLQLGDGRFVNISIAREDFKGKFNVLIPESASELPLTYGQKRNIIMQAIQLNSDEINSFLFSPENLNVTLRYFGISEFKSPEDMQTKKAYRIISELLQEGQAEGDQQQPQQTMEQPDPDIDDPTVQSRIFKNFLVSDAGQDQKQQNPIGYQNCLMYLKELSMLMQQQLMAQQQQTQGQGAAQ